MLVPHNKLRPLILFGCSHSQTDSSIHRHGIDDIALRATGTSLPLLRCSRVSQNWYSMRQFCVCIMCMYRVLNNHVCSLLQFLSHLNRWSAKQAADEDQKGPTCWKCKGACSIPLFVKKQKRPRIKGSDAVDQQSKNINSTSDPSTSNKQGSQGAGSP